jgi:competence protein ComEA
MMNLKRFLHKNVVSIIIGVVLIAMYVVYQFQDKNSEFVMKETDPLQQNIEQPIEKEEQSTSQQEEKMLYIDLKGEVNKPGVYEMKQGSRVQDVLQEAGGLTEAADPLLINLAQVLVDEMVIYVPKKGESLPSLSTSITSSDNDLLNINTASKSELENLEGIGPAKAESIITYRTEHGNFKNIEEIMEVSGIGEGVFNQIKDEITAK